MNNVLVSLVIPVYNVENYLRECLNSVLNQTHKELQVILVNDGSTDHSLSICEEFKSLDSRIEIISTENKGLSSARNLGIEVARAEYICFIDSDDFIATEYVEKLLNQLLLSNADIVMCNFYSYQDGEVIFDGKTRIFDETFGAYDFLERVYTYPGFYVPAWNKLYKKKIFDEIKYPDRTINEDSQIIRILSLKATKIVCIAEPLYFYRKREGSILTQKSEILLMGELNWIERDKACYLENGNKKLLFLSSKLYASKILEFYPKIGKELRNEMKNNYKNVVIPVLQDKTISKIVKLKYSLAYINMDLFQVIMYIFKEIKKRIKRSRK